MSDEVHHRAEEDRERSDPETHPELKEQICLLMALQVTERLQALLQACLGDGCALHGPGTEYAYLMLRGHLERLSGQTPEDERTTAGLLEALPEALGFLFAAPGEPEYLFGEGECEWEFTIRPALIKAVAELRAQVVRRNLLRVLYGADGESGDAPQIEDVLNLKEIDRVIGVVEDEKAKRLKGLFAHMAREGEPAAPESREPCGEGPAPDLEARSVPEPEDYLHYLRREVLQEQARPEREMLHQEIERRCAWDDVATCAHLLRRLICMVIAGDDGAPSPKAVWLFGFLRGRMLRELRAGGLHRRAEAVEKDLPGSLTAPDRAVLQYEVALRVLPGLEAVLGDVSDAFGFDMDFCTPTAVCAREGRLCLAYARERLAREHEDPEAEAECEWNADPPFRYPRDCPSIRANHPCPYPPARGVFRDTPCPELASAAKMVEELEGADRMAKHFHALGRQSRVTASYEDALIVSLLRRLVRAIAQEPGMLGDLTYYLYEFLRSEVMAALGREPHQGVSAAAETALPVSLREMSPSVVRAAAELRILPKLDFILPFVCGGIAREGDDAPFLLLCGREGSPCIRMREPDYCPEFLSGAPCPLPPLDRIPTMPSRREVINAAKLIAELEAGAGAHDAAMPEGSSTPVRRPPAQDAAPQGSVVPDPSPSARGNRVPSEMHMKRGKVIARIKAKDPGAGQKEVVARACLEPEQLNLTERQLQITCSRLRWDWLGSTPAEWMARAEELS